MQSFNQEFTYYVSDVGDHPTDSGDMFNDEAVENTLICSCSKAFNDRSFLCLESEINIPAGYHVNLEC